MRDALQPLLKLRADDIKLLARLCGSTMTGPKAALVEALDSTVRERTRGLHKECLVTSVDLGIENIGVCQIRAPPWPATNGAKPVVERWFHYSLPRPFTHKFPIFADHALDLTQKLGFSDAFVLEKQRSRTASSAAIPNSILRVNVMEGMMFAALRLQHPNAVLQSVSPRSVVEFWRPAAESSRGELPGAKLSQGQMYKLAKRVRKSMVASWRADEATSPLVFNHESTKSPKADDVNDALVQAYTWLIWRANCAQLQANLREGRKFRTLLQEPK